METRSALVLMVLLAGFILAVDAIRCHQCNSYLDPGCAAIDANVEGPLNEKYLKECHGVEDMEASFCRKIDVTFLASSERRIIRNCGYRVPRKPNVDYCFDADNEGYIERICQCYDDACNSAPNTFRNITAVLVALFGCLTLIG